MPEDKFTLNQTVVLVGMMGCGKSTIGRRLAQYLGVEFCDIDHVIEKDEDMSVSEIFAKHGEEYFRKLEFEYIKRFLDGDPSIVAVGGGAFINPAIRELIKEKGISVWIHADFDTLLERVSRKKTRPLLEKGDKATILKDLMEKRYPIYELADIKVETGNGNHEVVMHRIIEALNGRA